jgi:hypothetical protein
MKPVFNFSAPNYNNLKYKANKKHYWKRFNRKRVFNKISDNLNSKFQGFYLKIFNCTFFHIIQSRKKYWLLKKIHENCEPKGPFTVGKGIGYESLKFKKIQKSTAWLIFKSRKKITSMVKKHRTGLGFCNIYKVSIKNHDKIKISVSKKNKLRFYFK